MTLALVLAVIGLGVLHLRPPHPAFNATGAFLLFCALLVALVQQAGV